MKNFLQQKLEINWTSDEIGQMFSLNPQKWKRDNAMQCNMVDYSGMNILHLAICFHPRSVCSLLRVLQDHNLTEHLINEQVCQLQVPDSFFLRFFIQTLIHNILLSYPETCEFLDNLHKEDPLAHGSLWSSGWNCPTPLEAWS